MSLRPPSLSRPAPSHAAEARPPPSGDGSFNFIAAVLPSGRSRGPLGPSTCARVTLSLPPPPAGRGAADGGSRDGGGGGWDGRTASPALCPPARALFYSGGAGWRSGAGSRWAAECCMGSSAPGWCRAGGVQCGSGVLVRISSICKQQQKFGEGACVCSCVRVNALIKQYGRDKGISTGAALEAL